ncbi:hypothetical protein DKX38_028733 [Salix brachista]|uniref:Uncharacterized protein n=1 Tax=Salix brachista TaxID=2182728 RepID=A0A5N5JHX3_9ROSI|nr:hypothetical protein DKX38_028733 [Salix brachista]
MNIPLEEEINKEEEASNDSKEEDLGIQASEEEFGHYSIECRKKAPVELHEQANYADEDAIIIKDSNGRLIAFVKMFKNRMFPLNIQYDATKCLNAITNILVEDPRVPEEEPQSPVVEDTTLFCLSTNNDPHSFNKAIKERKWIKAMDEDIHTIERDIDKIEVHARHDISPEPSHTPEKERDQTESNDRREGEPFPRTHEKEGTQTRSHDQREGESQRRTKPANARSRTEPPTESDLYSPPDFRISSPNLNLEAVKVVYCEYLQMA